MKISAFFIMSEPEKLCFPYLEAVKSFLPLCDEIIVVFNLLKEDDEALEKLKNLDPKVNIIYGLFDYERLDWASQGIMRTNGYYASTGDMVLMVDADDILHEKDIDKARQAIQSMYDNKVAYGFWMKYRINQREKWVRQAKHSGLYNKSILGNNFNFYGGQRNYVPNWAMLPEEQQRGQNTDVYVYGYERCWDTREIFEYKIKQRRIMESSANKVLPLKEYIQDFIKERVEKNEEDGRFMPISEQPQIIQEKLKEITPKQFGYSLFQEE